MLASVKPEFIEKLKQKNSYQNQTIIAEVSTDDIGGAGDIEASRSGSQNRDDKPFSKQSSRTKSLIK